MAVTGLSTKAKPLVGTVKSVVLEPVIVSRKYLLQQTCRRKCPPLRITRGARSALVRGRGRAIWWSLHQGRLSRSSDENCK